MNTILLLLLSANASLAAAQGLPDCAMQCMLDAARNSACGDDGDFNCLCASTYLMDAVTCFVTESSCSDSDVEKATSIIFRVCQSDIGTDPPTPTPSNPVATASTSSEIMIRRSITTSTTITTTDAAYIPSQSTSSPPDTLPKGAGIGVVIGVTFGGVFLLCGLLYCVWQIRPTELRRPAQIPRPSEVEPAAEVTQREPVLPVLLPLPQSVVIPGSATSHQLAPSYIDYESPDLSLDRYVRTTSTTKGDQRFHTAPNRVDVSPPRLSLPLSGQTMPEAVPVAGGADAGLVGPELVGTQ